MQYSPEQKNSRLVNAIIAAALVFAGISYALPIVFRARGVTAYMPWLFSLLTIASVATALYFLVRYKMTSFTYIIRPRSDFDTDPTLEAAYAGQMDVSRISPDWLDFVVMKAQGSRVPVMECVLSFSDLVEIVPIAKDGKNGIPHAEIAKKYRERAVSDFSFYDYTYSYRWNHALELVFIDGQKYVGIIIEADEAFEEMLRRIHTEK